MTVYENMYLILYMPPLGVLAGLFIAAFLYWFSTD